ncbi:uncharacterized protein [Arachis hypogaea]|uniref:uncharacterized protein n=1 Tax=Arachis hypogaea TaxID=3818 RepID=UPI000DECC8F7|nr:uncharacterized protein LOC112748171 [Arachis hypogaea]
MAKQQAIVQIYSDWEESYNKVSRVVLYYDGHLVIHNCNKFDKVFWAPPYVEAFKHCKPFIFVDGMHLYGKYGGVLLIAVAQDDNINILPVAFAIVESRTTES